MAARLGATKKARTLRGAGAGLVIDGPFAETKEQLLGFYVVDCATEEAAIEAGARPAPRQSQRGLRDPPHPALSSRRAHPDDGGCDIAHSGSPPSPRLRRASRFTI